MSCEYCKRTDLGIVGETIIDFELTEGFLIGNEPAFDVYASINSNLLIEEYFHPAIVFEISNTLDIGGLCAEIYAKRIFINYCPFCGEKLI